MLSKRNTSATAVVYWSVPNSTKQSVLQFSLTQVVLNSISAYVNNSHYNGYPNLLPVFSLLCNCNNNIIEYTPSKYMMKNVHTNRHIYTVYACKHDGNVPYTLANRKNKTLQHFWHCHYSQQSGQRFRADCFESVMQKLLISKKLKWQIQRLFAEP